MYTIRHFPLEVADFFMPSASSLEGRIKVSRDFFLINRAHQLARLCQTPAIEFPPAKARQKLPEALQELLQTLENICKTVQATLQVEESKLSDRQRSELLQFEKQIVEYRFSADERVKKPAVALIRAIFADAAYFSGLKPLPQYTDAFAYELLFPSWLNLLTALMLPSTGTGKTKLDSRQQGALFHYLGNLIKTAPELESGLVGPATFIASRFDGPQCELLLQRLVDLAGTQGAALQVAIESFELSSRDAREFRQRLNAYLCVKHSSFQWPSAAEHRIADGRPQIRVLPKSIRDQLEALEANGDQWEEYFAIAIPLSHVVLSDQLLADDYVVLLERYPGRAAQLLTMLVQDKTSALLSVESQGCVAKLIERQIELDPATELKETERFVRSLAQRLTGYSESTLEFFCRQFIAEDAHRTALLDCCQADESERRERQQQLTNRVLATAAQARDDKRFLNLLCCITVITPEPAESDAKYALQALEGVVANRSIGNKEFEDLLGDLHSNAAAALGYLANPIMAGADKTPRLAALYLTLNDVTETWRSTGTIGNFSVVRARYSALTKLDGN